jgi:hypothetical protein
MKKQDLKTGDFVLTRNGDRGIVLLNTKDGDLIKYFFGRDAMYCFNEDLTNKNDNEFDIVEVWRADLISRSLNYSTEGRTRIYKDNPETKTITLNGVEITLTADGIEELRLQLERI